MADDLARGPQADPDGTRSAVPESQPGRSLGPYRLLEKVGEGGMGEVWRAEQTRPVHRQVALKIIKAGMDTGQVVARFEAERQALALMDHPAIATVFDGGATPEGRPYFAMEYVKGEPLTTYCDRHRLSTRARLGLFIQVCEGVQHAHQKGVIHRDLKPSNVLVTLQGEAPVPKIIDFGVAKATTQHLTERTLFTELGVLIGTPEYMSPEQAELTGLDIDTRTDVYALGVLLYELLTGTLPFDRKMLREKGLDEIRRTIREVDPPRPSTRITQLGPASTEAAKNRHTEPSRLASQLRGDLDWITMKALEKDRTRRYDTAMGLANDVRRHLDDQPVVAGPPSAIYRTKKFVRRHRFGVGAAATLVVLLVAFAAVTAVQARRIARERDRANQEAESARQVSDFLAGLFRVSDPREARGNSVTAREILDRGALRIERELKDQPLVQARLMATIGRVYDQLGLFDQALPLLESALETRRRLLGEEHLDVATTYVDLGSVWWRKGDFGKSRALFERGLAIREKLLGPEDLQVAESLHTVGNILWSQGEYDQAQRRLEAALAIREKKSGTSNPQVANTLNSLGATAFKKGDLAGAQRYWERTLAIREKELGPDHPYLAQTLNNIALVHTDRGNPLGARQLLERVVRIQEKVLGPNHPDLASGLSNLGEAFAASGDLAGARPYLKRAVEIEQVASPENPELALFLDRLATVMLKQGEVAAARGLFERSVALRERVLGPRSREVADSLVGLAECARTDGRTKEAAALYDRALALSRKPEGGYHPKAPALLDGYARVLRSMGETARAEEMERLAATLRKGS